MTEDDAADLQMPAQSAPDYAPSLFADSAPERTRSSEAVRSHTRPAPLVHHVAIQSERVRPSQPAVGSERGRSSRSPMPIIALIVAFISMVYLTVFLSLHKNTERAKDTSEEQAKTEPATSPKSAEEKVQEKAESRSVPSQSAGETKTPDGKPNGSNGAAAPDGAGQNPTGVTKKGGSGSLVPLPNGGKSGAGAQANAGGANGGKANSDQGPDGNNNEGGGDIPLSNDPGEKILFEGRWIEKAVRQKRIAQLSQRAFAEVEAHYKSKTAENTRIAPFNSPHTVVTAINNEDAFLVIGKYQEPGKNAVPFMCEVHRVGDGKWSIVHAQEPPR